MRRVAIVGLPFSGKSTVFEAVSRQHARGDRTANLAVVSVPEDRLESLARMYRSAEIVHARIELLDVPGMDARALHDAREADALAVVLRAFGDDADPARDLESFRAELAVADLETMERVRERVAKKARAGDDHATLHDEVAQRAEAVLSDGRWLSEEPWEPEHRRTLELLTPLTLTPVVHVLNAGESGDPTGPEPSVVVRAQLEAEAAELDETDARALLEGYGMTSSATDRLVRAVYDRLGLITYFTAGEEQSRAWAIRAGATAPEAAGQVHSDMQDRFIKAERVAFDDLVTTGSPEAAKEAGLVRLEGKAYEVKEGDVLLFRHG